MLTLVALASPARAQDATSPPGPADAAAAYRACRDALDRWEPVEDAALARLRDAGHAAAIALRHEGQVLGRGVAVGAGPGSITTAFTRALSEAERRLAVPNDALRKVRLVQIARDITLSLELAGPLVPSDAQSYAEFELETSFGLDGVAARLGERIEAAFPEMMFRSGISASSAARSVTSGISGEPGAALETMRDVRERLGVEYLRFRVVHIAQTGPGAAPVFLSRCARRVEPGDVFSTHAMLALADHFADHLMNRRDASRGIELIGNIDPVRGGGPRASAVQQAGSALALLRYSRTPGVEPDRAARAQGRAIALLADLGRPSQEGDPAPWTDPLSSCACVVALLEAPRDAVRGSPGAQNLLTRCWPVARGAYAWDAEANAPRGFRADIPESGRGLVALALVRMANGEPDENAGSGVTLAHAEAALRSVYELTEPDRLVTQMPWLGWAELESTAGPVPARPALDRMRRETWDHQLRRDDAARESEDLVGGFVFTEASVPLPTWHSSRPGAFLATAAGDDRLTDPDAALGELLTLRDLIRFIRQLAADDATSSFWAHGPEAAWGVRSSVWSPEMPADATSLSLLTVCETVRSWERIRARRAGVEP